MALQKVKYNIAELRVDHPLAKGLCAILFNEGGGPKAFSNRMSFTLTAGGSGSPVWSGKRLYIAGDGYGYLSGSQHIYMQAQSWFFKGLINPVGTYNIIWAESASLTAGGFSWGINNSKLAMKWRSYGNDMGPYLSPNTVTTNVFCTYGAALNRSIGKLQYYENGKPIDGLVTTTSDSITYNGKNDVMTIGYQASDTTTAESYWECLYVWPMRILKAGDFQILQEDPYEMFRPKRLWTSGADFQNEMVCVNSVTLSF